MHQIEEKYEVAKRKTSMGSGEMKESARYSRSKLAIQCGSIMEQYQEVCFTYYQ
jgi:hypothetical protein